jgi:hypothetical protein
VFSISRTLRGKSRTTLISSFMGRLLRAAPGGGGTVAHCHERPRRATRRASPRARWRHDHPLQHIDLSGSVS